ncbi:FAD:protein FMN transferase [Candidatus Dojkabacteria bacterium]|uniref:FAD:protein FMN transferase n=1 Tax=Candidatus Dojkabacteria bacterium TaxID=2099670 RepID=A0A955RLA3_9BACT|nr:FAD:protein FMN transferase [Candidatus Dojkabacteria bacterium]
MKQKIFHSRKFMNTDIDITVIQDGQSTIEIQESIENAYGEFDRIVKKFTRFNEDSELSNLNRQSGKWVKVSEELVFLVEYMLNMSKKTDGAFDPTIIDFLEVYGYDKNYDFSKLENPKLDKLVADIAKKKRSWKDIEVDKKENKIKLVEGQRIDLGGIGKGYAIDLAFDHLKKTSDNFLINAGGDIRSNGKNNEDKFWVVELKTPDGSAGQLELKNMSLSSSGSWARKVKQFHHLIDPRLGKPAEKNYSTVFVLGETSIQTDTWATALFILGQETKASLGDGVTAVFF